MPNTAKKRPLVSVVLAVFNEAEHIARCMASLFEQETPDFDLEILAVDGGSNDGTREYLERFAASDSRVRVLANRQRRAPFAFNLGLREAKGEYVCIFGAHAVYAKDYISVCLNEIRARGVSGCGGRLVTQPSSDSLEARLVAHGLAHPFGSSTKSFRTRPEGFADTLGYMVIRKDALKDIDGYSEGLLRNQDNDANQRLRARGHKLYCTWRTQCLYHPKESIRGMLAYAYHNGFWNVISFKENSASMGLRHFVPFFFVAGLLATALLSIASLFSRNPSARILALSFPVLLSLHLIVGGLASLQVAVQKKFLGALWLPLIFIGFHAAYGVGSLISLTTGAKAPVSPAARTLMFE
jgi:glycosyltransferase involved in cell wall biosynthesis